MAYSFEVRPSPPEEFARRAQMAQQAAAEGMNAEETAQAERMVQLAILLAQEGHAGPDWVQASFSGHANPEHKPMIGKGDTHCSFAVSAAATP